VKVGPIVNKRTCESGGSLEPIYLNVVVVGESETFEVEVEVEVMGRLCWRNIDSNDGGLGFNEILLWEVISKVPS